jgi:hypothetical protein
MALTKQNFTKSWLDSDDFPTFEESEDRVRADLQELHNQMQSYINGTLTEELDAALASKVPKAGLSMTASNNGDGTLTVSLRLGPATLASCHRKRRRGAEHNEHLHHQRTLRQLRLDSRPDGEPAAHRLRPRAALPAVK